MNSEWITPEVTGMTLEEVQEYVEINLAYAAIDPSNLSDYL